jgi:hypothetical protein
MKIDLPIVILYDCQDTDMRSVERAAGKIICTLRYDTEGDGTGAILIQGYPPEDGREKFSESGEVLLAYLPTKMDQKIKNRATRNPYDYAVGDEAERLVWQEEADEQAAQDGQFGAGA